MSSCPEEKGVKDSRLKRCPLCDLEAVIKKTEGRNEWRIACKGTFHAPAWHAVILWNYVSEEAAIEQWNKREHEHAR
jgi:hypothetical protein